MRCRIGGRSQTCRGQIYGCNSAEHRQRATWIDRHDQAGSQYRATSHNTAGHIPGTTPVLSYHDYFTEYRAHPEHKALGPDREPCHPWTRGPLRAPTIQAAKIERIGKETIIAADDDPDPTEPISPEISYLRPTCPVCGRLLAGKQTYCSDKCRKRSARGPRPS